MAFVAGALIGFAGGRVYSIFHGPLHGGRIDAQIRDRMLHHLDSELKLTPQQHDQVKQIIDRHHQKMEEISAGMRPQMRQEIESMNAEIEKVLNPEQRQKFQSLSERMRQRHHGRGEPPPHP